MHMCVRNRKKESEKTESGRFWTTRCLEGSPASLDSWIPSLTMSTIENVVLEAHIQD